MKKTEQTREEARAFLKSLGYLKKIRVIEGAERDQVLTMLALVPHESSNNQRFWTDSWIIGNIRYDHTTGEDLDELVEIIEDDI